ncbi:MAG TPA: hypothetical protein VIP70_10260 [Nitrososphaeraceae archaeon]
MVTNREAVVGLIEQEISISKFQVDNNSIFFLKEAYAVCMYAWMHACHLISNISIRQYEE